MSPRLAFALNLAYEAGRGTLAHFATGPTLELKEDRSPVTVADREAETHVRRALAERFPGEGILGEEEGETGESDRRWVVDPIDGTKSFICGVPLYATLLSYEEGGVPEIGVCYFPALDLILSAESGRGAFCNGRPIRVSPKESLEQATLCCGGHASMERSGKMDGFQRLARKVMTTRTWGDAYGHALVAMGRVEAMIDPVLKRWDISAMQIIVEEAGGKYTDFVGQRNPQTEAVASNGLLHEVVLNSFRA